MSELNYKTHEGTDQLSEKDILKIISQIPNLSIYHPRGPGKKAIPQHMLKTLVWQMADTGARISEVLPTTVNDINFSYNIFRIRFAKGGWQKCKNAKVPDIPKEAAKFINPKFMKLKKVCESDCKLCNGRSKIRKNEFTTVSRKGLEIIAQYVEKNDLEGNDMLYANSSHKGHHYHRSYIWRICKELDSLCNLNYFDMLESGNIIEGLSTKAFRKSLTKNMADQCRKDPSQLRYAIRQLRHKDTKTILSYMSPSLEKLAKARQTSSFALS